MKGAARALVWFKRSAQQGHAIAQFQVALAYDRGIGVKADKPQAILWYKKSAQQNWTCPDDNHHHNGFRPAQSNLAAMYYCGRGVPVDKPQAKLLWEKAAQQGHVASIYELAGLCRDDTEDARGEWNSEAAQLFKKAADLGHAGAMKELALQADVDRDYAEGLHWWTELAESLAMKGGANAVHVAMKLAAHVAMRDVALASLWVQKAKDEGFEDETMVACAHGIEYGFQQFCTKWAAGIISLSLGKLETHEPGTLPQSHDCCSIERVASNLVGAHECMPPAEHVCSFLLLRVKLSPLFTHHQLRPL